MDEFQHFYQPTIRTGDALPPCGECGEAPTAPGFGARHEAGPVPFSGSAYLRGATVVVGPETDPVAVTPATAETILGEPTLHSGRVLAAAIYARATGRTAFVEDVAALEDYPATDATPILEAAVGPVLAGELRRQAESDRLVEELVAEGDRDPDSVAARVYAALEDAARYDTIEGVTPPRRG